MAQRIVPMIAYEDAAAAIDWLTEAFGFREREGQRYTAEDGTVGHAELELGGEVVMLATPNRDYQSPRRHRESCEAASRWLDNPWVIDGVFVQVEDVDEHHARAIAAGASVIRSPENAEPAGMRLYTVEDLEGHRWMFGERLGPPDGQ
ncbi:MAG TPA: VOC family protein [Gaiellaceae bacterium]|nr:VOC family protein [Gaiellaceae bacterium]